MTAKRRILAFEIGTFFTRYVVFENGRMGIPGTIATPVDSVESFYQALAHIANNQRYPLDGIAMSVPGFIDVHNHGNSGKDFSDGDYEGLKTLARYLAKNGITSPQARRQLWQMAG